MARKFLDQQATLTHKRTRRSTRAEETPEPEVYFQSKAQKANTEPLKPLTENQRRYINAIKNFTLTIATGPAGAGKTYIAGSLAAEGLRSGEHDKIIITRPAVEAGEKLGFLPGEIEEKYEPYLLPFREVLEERLGKSLVEYMLKQGRIEASPLAYMRGRTFKNAFVILDEAQNTTPVQMKMFLTRIGHNCRVVVNGDMSQHDLHGKSGLEDAVRRISHIPAVKLVSFERSDIVRSGIVQEIVAAYDEDVAALDSNRKSHP